MTVLEILKLMATLSVGTDNVTAGERGIFLQYLNLAHFELYQETASLNQDGWVSETLTKPQNTQAVTLAQSPYCINKVYDRTHQKTLNRLSLADLLEKDPDRKATGSPSQYVIQGRELTVYPLQTPVLSLKVWYVPQPTALTEQTREQDIPYPLAYHPVLADGALYYLFQEEGGFKNPQKALAAEQRWEKSRLTLVSYLYQSSGQTLSTFSNA